MDSGEGEKVSPPLPLQYLLSSLRLLIFLALSPTKEPGSRINIRGLDRVVTKAQRPGIYHSYYEHDPSYFHGKIDPKELLKKIYIEKKTTITKR